jgi:nucleotide-binding universal stress UspA family protein
MPGEGGRGADPVKKPAMAQVLRSELRSAKILRRWSGSRPRATGPVRCSARGVRAPPSPLLVATDLSPSADRALAWAARLARAEGIPLHLAHAVSSVPQLPAAAGLVDASAIHARFVAEQRAALEAAGREVDASALHLVEGEPVEALSALADRLAPRLLVLGRHEAPDRDRIGRVAARLVRAASRPVLSVPAASPLPSRRPLRLLCPTDLSVGADRALAEALAHAAWLDAEAHVLFVLDLPGYVAQQPELASELGRRVERELSALVERHRSGPRRIEGMLRHGPPAEEIARAADALDADVILLPTHARAGVARFFLGSVAERLIRGAARPVWTFRLGGSA